MQTRRKPSRKLLFNAALVAILCALRSAQAETALSELHVPDGFIIERVAGPPLVQRPIMASFDDEGRLFVTDSAGVNLPGSELIKSPPHRLLVLEDSTSTGHFDKARVYADKLVFPQGLLWHDGAVYLASPPCLWKLQDTSGSGVADRRTPLISGFALTGVSDDMHGACLGPDGRVYTCAGRFPHDLKSSDGRAFDRGSAPLLIRCKTDGTHAEVVGGTQGNGVEVAFSEAGDMFVSGTFYGGGNGLRDALIHEVEGGDYPVLDRPQETHEMKRTGELLPPLVHTVAAAPAGIMAYRGSGLGNGFDGDLFCAYFNLHKVQRHLLERDGATFRARSEDFLISSNPDFHPTDVLEDADGSILVVDTGGWFRIGCPTSRIAKPQVLGAIYRIRRKDAPRVHDPRGLSLKWIGASAEELVARLDDPRFIVQERAIRELAKLGAAAVPVLRDALKGQRIVAARRNAVWTLTRIDAAEARLPIRLALSDKDATVRQAAAYSAGLHRDPQAASKLIAMVGSDEPQVRREAATALGRIARPAAAPALLASLKGVQDRFLEHAMIYALIRINNRDAAAASLSSPDPEIKRGALIALDQMPDGGLKPQVVLGALTSGDPLLRRTASWIMQHHPDWARDMAGYLKAAVARRDLTDAQREQLKEQIVTFCRDQGVQDTVAAALSDRTTSSDVRLLLMQAMAESPLSHLPSNWTMALAGVLEEKDERLVREAVLCAQALPAQERPALVHVDAKIDFPDSEGLFGDTHFSDDFHVRWSGVLRIPQDGRYTFYTESDDGSRLLIDGKTVVENGGWHAMREREGAIDLKAGDHAIRLDYFQGGGNHGCRLLWQKDGSKQIIAPGFLLHEVRHTHALEPGLIGRYFDQPLADGRFPDEPAVDLSARLAGVASDPNRSDELRVEAADAAAPDIRELQDALFQFLVRALSGNNPPLVRATAAEALGRAPLTTRQLLELSRSIRAAGPLELPRLLTAYESSSDQQVGQLLVSALQHASALRSLRPDVIDRAIAHYPPQIRAATEPLKQKLALDLQKQNARLAELQPLLSGGDPVRGREVFFGTRAACSTCHSVRGRGGDVGPDLSKIGSIRTGRDLLEAVVFPSASFARGFEPYLIQTRDGQVQSGIIRSQTADYIELATGPAARVRIRRSAIAQIRPAAVSIMPEGLDQQLSHQELSDLLAFLQSLR